MRLKQIYQTLLETVGKLRNSDNMMKVNIKSLELSIIELQKILENDETINEILEGMLSSLAKLEKNCEKNSLRHREGFNHILFDFSEIVESGSEPETE